MNIKDCLEICKELYGEGDYGLRIENVEMSSGSSGTIMEYEAYFYNKNTNQRVLSRSCNQSFDGAYEGLVSKLDHEVKIAIERRTEQVIRLRALLYPDNVLIQLKKEYEQCGKIAAIKLYRIISEEGLKEESKEFIEAEAARGNWKLPHPDCYREGVF